MRVIARIAPDARIVDLTHGVPRHDVRTGALVLRRTLPYTSPGVHIAVVDPEVGEERRAIALRVRGGPHPRRPRQRAAVARRSALRRRAEVVDIALSPLPARADVRHLPRTRSFRPVAAQLAAGAALADAGDRSSTGEVTAAHAARPDRGRRSRRPRDRQRTASAT